MPVPANYCVPLMTGDWKSDYFQFLIDHLTEFKRHASDIIDDFRTKDYITTDRDKKAYNQNIHENVDNYCHFYQLYKEGKRIQAHELFFNILEKQKPLFTSDFINKYFTSRWTPFYRMRNDSAIIADRAIVGSEPLFHIPFSKRHRCNNARFNSHGTPILYVSDDIQTTWLEMKQTCLSTTTGRDRLDLGIFKNSIAFHYYDLSVRDINVLWTNSDTSSDARLELLDYLTLYPLICGLHSDIDHETEYVAYNKAYIMPSLFMEYFIKESLLGFGYTKTFAFKYTSVKPGSNPNSSNFAFYAHQKNTGTDYCTELKSKFLVESRNFYHEDMLATFPTYDKIDVSRLDMIKSHVLGLFP